MGKNKKPDNNSITINNFKIINPIDENALNKYFSNLPEISLPEINISNSLDKVIDSLSNLKDYSFNFSIPWEGSNIFPKSETKKKTPEAFLKKSVNSFANHISEETRKYVRDNRDKLDLNLFSKKSEMAILSVDIRNSTHLMEKAISEEKFGEFLALLTEAFKTIILENNGIYDKFTGDGVICYFPEFFSGKDYLYYAIKASQELHDSFKKIYLKCANFFTILLKEAGLGIGIDSGSVLLKLIADDLTVIGNPVINACRLNGAPAYNTYVNNQAYLQIISKYNNIFKITELEYDYKHEGPIIIHKIEFAEKITFKPELPPNNRLLKVSNQ